MKKITLLSLLLIIFSSFYAQTENYTTFQKDGNLYFNKNLPIYFWLSTSADDNSKDILMQSQSTKKYANPMYFDTDGYNTLQTNSATDDKGENIKHITFKIYSDANPPEVNSKFLGTRKYINGKFIYKKGLKIALLADDSNSGVAKIFYSINSNEYFEYKSKIIFETPGLFEFKYYAVDNTGNNSKIHTFHFSIE